MVHHNKYTKKRSHLKKDGTRRNLYTKKGGNPETQQTEETSQPTLFGIIGNSLNSTAGKVSGIISGTPSKENTVATQQQASPMETSPPVTPPNEKVANNDMEEMKSYTMELVNTLKEKEEIENKLTTLLATMPAAFNEPVQEDTSLVKDETMSSSDEEESQQDNMSVQSDEGSQQGEENMTAEDDKRSVESDGEESQQGEDEDNTSAEDDNMSVEQESSNTFDPNEQEKEEKTEQ